MHTETIGGVTVTVLTVPEAEHTLEWFKDHDAPSSDLQKEIASLSELHRVAKGAADDSLHPEWYHVSAKTHKVYGVTDDGRYVMVCPETGELLAIRAARPIAVRFTDLTPSAPYEPTALPEIDAGDYQEVTP